MAKRTLAVALGLALCLGGSVFGVLPGEDILVGRGDANNDGAVNLTDVNFISNYLFSEGEVPPCLNQADADDNGAIEMADSVYLSNYLFLGGPPPAAPGPNNTECYQDKTTPNLGCLSEEAWACAGY